ncbi:MULTISPECIES: AAA family ATPase [Rhizobium]|uniref:AAA family ATPase n=1 Tax=Rhizobium aouanii TaxID=3118145 RepID=A0ABU8CKB6_9HYPH|nr:AAA family ATPase [Rhizobium acaciae]MCW1410791.1 AAA family ATPase [Rhizobium acaciae]MCW1742910.1 AAA family ATPase [Rhizobium acaciae]MCW1750106.1 AAA family ATPase [Rhizobium acaciae]
MKFTRVRLKNIFAYHGLINFDFSITSQSRNVVLIWGRNGMGKTSFLNAVKLLFTGIAQKQFRTVGFPPSLLNEKQYLLGDGARWSGLVNRSARRKAAVLNETVETFVEISWTDEDEREFTAQRWWQTEGNNTASGVYIDFDGNRKAGEAAEDFLEETLPSDLVKFFFFDGEDIKSIAESSGTLQKDINRLLQLTFVEELAEEVRKVADERRLRGMQTELRRQVDAALASQRSIETSIFELEEQLVAIDDTLTTDGIDLRKLEIRRANLSSGASELQRDALEKQLKKLNKQLEDCVAEISTQLPLDIPVVANLRILKRVRDEVEARIAAGGSAEANFVRQIDTRLPGWVAEAAPDMPHEDVAGIARYLSGKLNGALNLPGSALGTFAAADVFRIEKMRRMVEHWSAAGGERQDRHVRLLEQASQTKAELAEVTEALLKLEVGAQGNLEEFRDVTNMIEELRVKEARLNQQKGVSTTKLTDFKQQRIDIAETIIRLQASQNQATTEMAESKFATSVSKALNEIALRLKDATRTELEDLLNDRFRRIISHPLIKRIGIDDAYVLTFYEENGRPIGRTSLSSGMKQLAATALLWAMKDSANRDIPVIIDTPLGRIDRENQDHLLKSYYPALARQVIILPTNAEIDARKRGLLEPRIAEHYLIENNTGDAAEVKQGQALVELA